MKAILLLLVLMLFLLIAESVAIRRRLRLIPLRISVSGTRGKTWVTRALASVLRESGLRVMAKTTGSEAAYILPDGSVEAIRRRGVVSITEQKRTVARAVKERVGCLVTEIMSIKEENHRAESAILIKPHITVFTNFRADHIDSSGESREEIVRHFCSDIYRASELIINEEDITELFAAEAKKRGASVTVAAAGQGAELGNYDGLPRYIPEENVRLVCTVARKMGISDDVILRGIGRMRYDIGEAGIYRFYRQEKELLFVNSFAANDPVSTEIMIQRIMKECGTDDYIVAGLLALRSDRAERTLQWCRYLEGDGLERFRKLFVTGREQSVVKRRVAGAVTLKNSSPEEITNSIINECSDRTILFGLANIAGMGRELAEYWKREGTAL